jgi:uncharacterized protein YjbI with pentapeptide repeats
MANNLFQNDNIVGNSLIGFEFRGIFKYDDDDLIDRLKSVLNREISFSNIEYKLLEPTDSTAVLMKDGLYSIVRTNLYNYYEAVYVMPKILELLKEMKEVKNTYIHFDISFNKDFCNVENLNLIKFLLDFNESSVLKNIGDVTENGDIKKITTFKPTSYSDCLDKVQKQIESYRYLDEDSSIYGLDFSDINVGVLKFKYAEGIDYRNKWEGILKSLNHTITTLYNSTKYPELTDEQVKKIDELNEQYDEYEKAFRCYELFVEKYKSIKITSDLNDDKSVIDVIFPSIKEKLFDLVIVNNIKSAEINYDSDVSRLQVKDITLKGCYHLNGVDIVDSEIQNSNIRNCDIYDTKITNSNIIDCNLFGYGNCKDSKFKNCFISRNIDLKDCDVTGKLGKMGGTMRGGSLKNTTVLIDSADIHDDVEKINVNEIV